MTTEAKPEDRSTVIDVEKLLRGYKGSKKSGDGKQVQIDETTLKELTERLKKENKRKDRCLERIGILLLVLFFLGLTVTAEHLNATTKTTTAPSENGTTPETNGSATGAATTPIADLLLNARKDDSKQFKFRAQRISRYGHSNGP